MMADLENDNIISPLLVIVGPTASGKSALAMNVARAVDAEIICADSRTVYKGMDIGTAKPSLADQEEIRHHLLDIVDPREPFSVALFKQLAQQAVNDISSRGKMPILVGGTGLYIDAVIFDYKFGKKPNSKERLKLLENDVDQLQQICVTSRVNLPENALNKRHLVRTIELGGQIKDPKKIRDNTLVVGITTSKDILRQQSRDRVIEMVNRGLLDEIETILEKYGSSDDVVKGNVYSAYGKYLKNEISFNEATEEAIRNDMRLVKKQMTWFKRNPNIVWGSIEELKLAVDTFVGEQKLDTMG
jgi:tRNA dimethylallyltransferase